MEQKVLYSRRGFMIIEVVLVLAIAGLIFLMVFIALPAVRRNQRDAQRRQDYTALLASMTNYKTNNNGRLPNAYNSFIWMPADKYINTSGLDPSGSAYHLSVFSWKLFSEHKGDASFTIRTDLEKGAHTVPQEGDVLVVLKSR